MHRNIVTNPSTHRPNTVVGIHQRPNDLAVNVCKTKALTNMRSATKGITVGIVSNNASMNEVNLV
jgi:predicted membrane GTPase involved in stress response